MICIYYICTMLAKKNEPKTKTINENHERKTKMINEKSKQKRKAYSFRLSIVSSNNRNSDLSLFILCTFVIRSAASPTS